MTTEAPEPQQNDTSFNTSPTSNDPPKLQVDFSWKKFQARITSHESPSQPVYVVDFNTFKSPSIVFTSISSPDESDKKVIGSGTLHSLSIDADYELHGRKGKLKALKRWKTAYTHLSHTFSSSNEDGSPETMTWASESGFTKWDFICLNENQMPVARFSSNVWAVKKVGEIEFMGDKATATSVAARDEVVVVGITLFYCMLLRSSSIFSFFAAIFARPGPLEEGKKEGKKGEGSGSKGSSE